MSVELFGKGAVIDRPDNRDFQWAEIAGVQLPFNWDVGYDVEQELGKTLGVTGFRLPVKDQNGSFSCGGQAWASNHSVLEAAASKTFEERSARFIYSQTWQGNGGSAGRDNANILVKQGCALEDMIKSYNQGSAPAESFMRINSDITDGVRVEAKKVRALSYANVPATIDVIAQAIRDNMGVVIGIVGANNGTWASSFPQRPATAAPQDTWRHWMYVGKAKLLNGVKHIGALNSWGKQIGDLGWQWLSADYVNGIIPSLVNDGLGGKAIWQVWTLMFNPNPTTGFHYNFTKDIEFGQNNGEVVALQKALQESGEFPAGVQCTGFYGDITRRAVLAFQVRYSVAPQSELISVNGKRVGSKTRKKLNEIFN